MEAKANESAYKALKKLDESGDLLFELSTLVEELIKVYKPSPLSCLDPSQTSTPSYL